MPSLCPSEAVVALTFAVCCCGALHASGTNAQMARNADALAILRTFSATPLTAAPAPATDPDAGDNVDGTTAWADDEAAASLQNNPLPFHQLVADPWAVLRPYVRAALPAATWLMHGARRRQWMIARWPSAC